MKYKVLSIDFKEAKNHRFYREICVKEDLSLEYLGKILVFCLGGTLEHSYLFDDGEFSYVDKSWLGNYWSSNLARWVRYYAHVYESDTRDASKLSEILDGETTLKEGVYLFLQTDDPEMVSYYSRDDIVNWKQVPGENGVTLSKSTEGCDAFMNDLVRKIKKNNIK